MSEILLPIFVFAFILALMAIWLLRDEHKADRAQYARWSEMDNRRIDSLLARNWALQNRLLTGRKPARKAKAARPKKRGAKS